MRKDEVFRFSKKDLPDYFWLCGASREKAAKNVVGRGFAPGELLAAGFHLQPEQLGADTLWLGLKFLCMGDLNALAHANTVNEAIGRTRGLF